MTTLMMCMLRLPCHPHLPSPPPGPTGENTTMLTSLSASGLTAGPITMVKIVPHTASSQIAMLATTAVEGMVERYAYLGGVNQLPIV